MGFHILTCCLCRQVPGCLLCLLRLVAQLGVLGAPIALGAIFGFGVAQLASGLTIWLWGICCTHHWPLGAVVVSIVFSGTWALVGILSAWMIRRQMHRIPARRGPDTASTVAESLTD